MYRVYDHSLQHYTDDLLVSYTYERLSGNGLQQPKPDYSMYMILINNETVQTEGR